MAELRPARETPPGKLVGRSRAIREQDRLEPARERGLMEKLMEMAFGSDAVGRYNIRRLKDAEKFRGQMTQYQEALRSGSILDAPLPGANPEVPDLGTGMAGVAMAGGGRALPPGIRPPRPKIRTPGTRSFRGRTAPPFFSRLRQVVEDPKTQAKQTGKQWSQFLTGPKRGVHAEEMKWTGLADVLRGKAKERVTRDQIIEHLNKNEVRIEEVTKGRSASKVREEEDRISMELHGRRFDSLEAPARREVYALIPDASPTKFQQYTLPGATNYREVLLKLPSRTSYPVERASKELYGKPYDQLTTSQQTEVLRYGSKKAEAQGGSDFTRGHWDEPNVIAHLRLSDRKVGGKRTLLVEEIQSDWAKKGREEGFAIPKEKSALLDKEYRSLVNKNYGARQEGREPNQTDIARAKELEVMLERSDRSGLPTAPFVEKTESWTKLGLKRVLKMAADEGYDKVGIVRGQESVARYDLSKHINEIHYSASNFVAYNHKGETVIQQTGVRPADLPDLIGHGPARRLMAQKPQGTLRSLVGEDLHIEGKKAKGMKVSYDEIVPQILNKLGKEFGVKVEIEGGRINTGRDLTAKLTYSGPNFTQEQVQKYAVRHWGTLRTQMLDVVEAMKNGKSFSEAMGEHGSITLARTFGGKLSELPMTTVPIHTLDIPDAMKQKIKERGFPVISRRADLVPQQRA